MITIIENYGFERDRSNFILYYTGTRKKGIFGKPKEVLEVKKAKGSKKSKQTEPVEEMVDFQEKLGYFNTVSGMLKAVADNYVCRKIETGKVQDIKDYLNEYNAVVTRLEEALAKVENLPTPTKIKSNLQRIKDVKAEEKTEEDDIEDRDIDDETEYEDEPEEDDEE